jgi:hypothetical protein
VASFLQHSHPKNPAAYNYPYLYALYLLVTAVHNTNNITWLRSFENSCT